MAEEPLISSSWYRVAELKPKLRSHARIHRHVYRGQDWYVLQDQSSGRFHRFPPEAYYAIGLMDGERTVGDIWSAAWERLGDDAPTQDEMISLIGQLYLADVLQSDARPDFADMESRAATTRRRERLGYVRSPVAMRFPLFDPERFLQRTAGVAHALFRPLGALLWLAVVALGAVLAALHWGELTGNVADQVLSAQNLLLVGLIYPVIKVIHEFGHAYAVKRWGGEVHEMGVMLLVFMPIPYVDASAATAFPQKWRRVAVDAAGILVELFLAAVGLLVWVAVEPGLVRAVAFNVVVIASVSTLLFNGNPLLRFDAYYILADSLEIPNMGQRATRYLGYLFQRYLMGVTEVESPAQSPGERRWLGAYAVASTIYRAFIIVAIVLIAASRFFFAGVLIALWTGVGILGRPLYNGLKALRSQPHLARRRGRAYAVVGGLAAAVLVLCLGLPAPMFTVTEGIVRPPQGSVVRAGAGGIVDSVLVASGTTVETGQPLIVAANPELSASVLRLRARVRELEARLRSVDTRDPAAAQIVRQELQTVGEELGRAEELLAELTTASPADGLFLIDRPEDLPGHYISRGSELGYVVDPQQLTIQAVVRQADVELVRHRTHRVEARFSERIGEVVPVRLVREMPAASAQLPSLALSLEGGGRIAMDPRSRQRPQAYEPIFRFELRATEPSAPRVGERVYVRFVHDAEPLGYRWWRGARRLLLSRFGV